MTYIILGYFDVIDNDKNYKIEKLFQQSYSIICNVFCCFGFPLRDNNGISLVRTYYKDMYALYHCII